MGLLDDLNLLTGKVLGQLPNADLPVIDPTDNPTDGSSQIPLLTKAQRDNIFNSLKKLKNDTKYAKARAIIDEVAWRCLNPRCKDPINGCQTNSIAVRKTCKKCAQPRTNKLTVQQELVIQMLMDTEGLTFEEALERVTHAQM